MWHIVGPVMHSSAVLRLGNDLVNMILMMMMTFVFIIHLLVK